MIPELPSSWPNVELLMMRMISARDAAPTGSETWRLLYHEIERLQVLIEARFGSRFTYGTYND